MELKVTSNQLKEITYSKKENEIHISDMNKVCL